MASTFSPNDPSASSSSDHIFDIPDLKDSEDQDSSHQGREEGGSDLAGNDGQGKEKDNNAEKDEDEADDDAPKKKKKRLNWVKDPISTLFVEVWKEGQIVDRIALGGKSKYMFGRCEEADIILKNPYLSRKHAALVHGCPPGTSPEFKVTLIDLKTQTGTYVTDSYPCREKRRKVAADGAGLKEGMCFRFGESSQSYVLRGTTGVADPKNPNFKSEDHRSQAISRDLKLSDREDRKTVNVKLNLSRNPFQMGEEKEYSLPVLPKAALSLDELKKLGGGDSNAETTFSFHKKNEADMERNDRIKRLTRQIQIEERKALKDKEKEKEKEKEGNK